MLVQAPLRDVQEQVSAVERRLVFGGSLAFGVALLAGLLAAEPLARRLARLQAAAERIARGSFGEPIVDHKGDEIGELARSLEEMRQRLDALDRARSAFIANASHELRTPLTALGGYLELLTEGGLTEAERDEFLDTMGEQVQRLTKLATDLLDLSRLDAGGFTVAHDELELGELASDAAREMQALGRSPRLGRGRGAGHGGARPRRRGAGAPGAARAGGQRGAPYTARLDCHVEHRDDALGRQHCRLRRRPGHPFRAARARIRALLPRAWSRGARHWPRPRDRPRAGRAHGWPTARDEYPAGARFTLELPGPAAEGTPAYTGNP